MTTPRDVAALSAFATCSEAWGRNADVWRRFPLQQASARARIVRFLRGLSPLPLGAHDRHFPERRIQYLHT